MSKARLRTSVIALLTLSAPLSCSPDARSESLLGPDTGSVIAPPSGASLPSQPPTPPAGYFLVRERAMNLPQTMQVSRVIGVLGGTLSLAGHAVEVPPGAVTLPTVFTLTTLPSGYVEVELTALTTTLLGRVVSIGEQGLKKPVPVSLTFARAANVADASRLRIMRVTPDGRHEILESRVNHGRRTVTADLDHFSRYCLIAD